MRRLCLLLPLIAAGCASPDLPRPASSEEAVVLKGVFERAPTAEEIAAVYPAAALARRISGRATLTCTVDDARALQDCAVSADPHGFGFAEAASKLTPLFQAAPSQRYGLPAEGARVFANLVLQPPPATFPPPTLPAPVWRKTVAPADRDRFYPERAREMEVHGQARLQCTVRGFGVLTGCVIIDESPPGFGFGLSAIRMAEREHAVMDAVDGEPTEGKTVRLSFVFQLAP